MKLTENTIFITGRHLNKEGKIDHLIIYMRPLPVAQKFAEVISQRLQPAR